jgi:predicted NUDIX family phosphoesterase
MEPIDVGDDQKLIETAALREIEEETGFTITEPLKFVGIICVTDPGEPLVHHVHIGAVYEATTTEETFGGEVDKQNHKWMGPEEIGALTSRMEVWAKEVACNHLREYLGIVAVA